MSTHGCQASLCMHPCRVVYWLNDTLLADLPLRPVVVLGSKRDPNRILDKVQTAFSTICHLSMRKYHVGKSLAKVIHVTGAMIMPLNYIGDGAS